jgi:hypothetical protein
MDSYYLQDLGDEVVVVVVVVVAVWDSDDRSSTPDSTSRGLQFCFRSALL